MTVSLTVNRWAYLGNGVTTSFTYDNRIFEASDLKVFVGGVLRIAGSDYEVSGVGLPGGGSVTFSEPPAGGASVTIVRDVPATQGLDLAALGSFPAEENEKALDRLTVLIQQLADSSARVIRQPDSDATAIAALPHHAARAGKLLSFDSNGNPTLAALTVLPDALSALHHPRVNAGGTGYELISPAATFAAIKQEASAATSGVVELATDSETQTGTDAARAVTPASLSARSATEARSGLAELATDVETVAGADTARVVTPAALTARLASPGAIGGTTPGAVTATSIATDTVTERSVGAGVTVDGALIKDNALGASGAGLAAVFFGSSTNALSVYEEGSFTPTLGGSVADGTHTYSVQVGRYIRIGNLVHFWVRLALTVKDPALSGNVSVKGLPFPSSSVTGLQYSAAVGALSDVNLTAGFTYGTGVIVANSSAVFLTEQADNLTGQLLMAAAFANTSIVTVSGTYRTG